MSNEAHLAQVLQHGLLSDNDDCCSSRFGEILDGRYELGRKIGEGGMGEVYEARHRVLGRRFAVKLMHPELVRSNRMLRRFSRESLSASRIESEHVVAVLDCGHLSDGAPYFAMEYLFGQNLRCALREGGQLHAPRAVRLALQVCRGLHAAHELGLVHRDLKPENIFIVRKDDGRECAKILDFGVVQTNGGNSTARAGALIGTLRYMAPEQARGDERVDQRADLYALGTILYECLAGVVAHPGKNTEEVLFNVMSRDAVPLRELRPELHEGLASAVHRCLEREPDKRFQSAAALIDALESYATDRARAPALGKRRDSGVTAAATLTASPASSVGKLPRARGSWLAPAWVTFALLCGVAVHFIDRALLAAPLATSATVNANQATIEAVDEPRRQAQSNHPSVDLASNVGTNDRSQPAGTSQKAAQQATADAPAKPARAKSVKRAPSDDYRTSLDWKNPYRAAPSKQ
ncbi:MAG: protein kinase [Polyangiaceae bacterium]